MQIGGFFDNFGNLSNSGKEKRSLDSAEVVSAKHSGDNEIDNFQRVSAILTPFGKISIVFIYPSAAYPAAIFIPI